MLRLATVLVYAFAMSAAVAQQPSTPAEQFKALATEYQNASSAGRVLTDEERWQFVGEVFKKRHKIALKLIELAEKYPDDSIAVDALMQATWHVNNTWYPVELVGPDEATGRALALLQRKYIQSEKLGQVCQRVAFGFRK